jgi:hypothetical protein
VELLQVLCKSVHIKLFHKVRNVCRTKANSSYPLVGNLLLSLQSLISSLATILAWDFARGTKDLDQGRFGVLEGLHERLVEAMERGVCLANLWSTSYLSDWKLRS